MFNITPEGELILGPPPRGLLYLAIDRKPLAAQLGMDPADVSRGEETILSVLSAELEGITSLPEPDPAETGPPLTRLERVNMVLVLLLTEATMTKVPEPEKTATPEL